MYNIIPLILILISLSVIITIVVRKFSVLANLDIESIQAEREAKFKEQIIGKRLKRNFLRYYAKVARIVSPIGRAGSSSLKWTYAKLVDFKENYNKDKAIKGDSQQAIDKLFSEAEELAKKEDLEQAEEKFIQVIALDSKNIEAFKRLGRLYFERKNYNEAKQAMEHALRLLEKDFNASAMPVELNEISETLDRGNANRQLAGIYFDLSLVCNAMEKFKEALVNINKALYAEPNNPRYLDTKFEISVMNENRAEAFYAYQKLLEVNPDNQKLEDFKKQINEL